MRSRENEFKFGLRMGYISPSLKIKNAQISGAGIAFGLVANVPLTNTMSLNPEINSGFTDWESRQCYFDGSHYESHYSCRDYNFTDAFLNIPILTRYYPFPYLSFLYFQTGLNVDLNINRDNNYDFGNRNFLDLGLIFGIGFNLGNFTVDSRYIIGITDMFESSSGAPNYLGAGISYGGVKKELKKDWIEYGFYAGWVTTEKGDGQKVGMFTNIPLIKTIFFSPGINSYRLKEYYYIDEGGYFYEEDIVKYLLSIPLLFKFYPIPACYLAAGSNMDISAKDIESFNLVLGIGLFISNYVSLDLKLNLRAYEAGISVVF
ncbi:MAG: PorT family protein [Fibromonadaceae bacterium]|nr:PorT family protein [Fibromonadaceae bacterium]